jgi:hypothetical protein
MTELNTPSSKEIAKFIIENTLNSKTFSRSQKVNELVKYLAASIEQNNIYEKEAKAAKERPAPTYDISVSDALQKENEVLKAEAALTRVCLHEMNNLVLGTALFNDVSTSAGMREIIKVLESRAFNEANAVEMEDIAIRCTKSDELVKEAKAGANTLWEFLTRRGHYLPKDSETTTLDKAVKLIIDDVEKQDNELKGLQIKINEQVHVVNLFYKLNDALGILTRSGDHVYNGKTNFVLDAVKHTILTSTVVKKEYEGFTTWGQTNVKQQQPVNYEMNNLVEVIYSLLDVIDEKVDPKMCDLRSLTLRIQTFVADFKTMKKLLHIYVF